MLTREKEIELRRLLQESEQLLDQFLQQIATKDARALGAGITFKAAGDALDTALAAVRQSYDAQDIAGLATALRSLLDLCQGQQGAGRSATVSDESPIAPIGSKAARDRNDAFWGGISRHLQKTGGHA